MTVLEVGPGTGTYTMGAARRWGPEQGGHCRHRPKMIKRVKRRAEAEGIDNVQAQILQTSTICPLRTAPLTRPI